MKCLGPSLIALIGNGVGLFSWEICQVADGDGNDLEFELLILFFFFFYSPLLVYDGLEFVGFAGYRD